ncbi:hypothetical protein SFRURICE_003173, partial [Spodoptera frugiperda]
VIKVDRLIKPFNFYRIRIVTTFIVEGVGKGAHYRTQCHCTMHTQFSPLVNSTITEKFRKAERSPALLCPTCKSNPKPVAKQSYLRPIEQRDSFSSIIEKNHEIEPTHYTRISTLASMHT